MSITELNIQSPPNTLFQGVTSNWKNNLTYQEFLLGILKKLNEVIEVINKDEEFIEEFRKQYDILLVEFEKVKNEVDTLSDEITASVQAQLDAFENQVSLMIANVQAYLVAYSDVGDQRLEQEIQNIQLGQIQVIDPTTGITSSLQTVINNLAGSSQNALTATEYDALELTATAFDAYDITAYNYDFNGKAILTEQKGKNNEPHQQHNKLQPPTIYWNG